MRIQLTPHAEEQIEFRKLTPEHVIRVVSAPEEIVRVRGNRYFAQSRYSSEGKEYLLRVLVEKIGDDNYVVTVYPTSKVRKYWQGG